MSMMMDPDNRMLIEHMFDGLEDISSNKGQLYTADDVAHPSGGGGLVSTTHDYARFCLFLSGGGELDGVRVLSSKTLAYMTQNHLKDHKDMKDMYKQVQYTETAGAGAGFGPSQTGPQTNLFWFTEGMGMSLKLFIWGAGLGFSVIVDPALYGSVSSMGAYAWGGAAATAFWLG